MHRSLFKCHVCVISCRVVTNVEHRLTSDLQISRRGDGAVTPIIRVRKRPALSLPAPV